MQTPAILIVGPSWVGDMVMAQSLFHLLKKRHPDVAIDVLAPSWSEPLLSRMPEVREAISMPVGHGQLQLGERYRLGKSLRSRAYQQAIVLPNSFKSALTPFFAQIKRRTGWRGEWRYGLLNDIRILDKATYAKMVERFCALALAPGERLPAHCPRPRLVSEGGAVNATAQAFHVEQDKLILALCPGAEFGPAKRWPSEYYATVAKHYVQQGWQVWLFGSAKDSVVADEILTLAGAGVHSFAGQTTLAQAIDLMSLSNLVLSNDSGLMHIAAALDKPVAVVYGSTSPLFTPPLSDKVAIISKSLSCSPCFKRTCPLKHLHCLTTLAPSEVIEKMQALVAKPTEAAL